MEACNKLDYKKSRLVYLIRFNTSVKLSVQSLPPVCPLSILDVVDFFSRMMA